MRLPRFLSGGGPNALATDLGLLLLRLFAGLALAFGHGLGKLPPSPGFVEGVAGMGFPLPGLFAWAAAIAEFAGGLLLAAGLMTRPASVFILLTMATAGFIRHAPDPFSGKEKAFLFLFVALLFLIAGAGRYSIDAFIGRRKEESRRQGAGGKQMMTVLIAALLITAMGGPVSSAQEMDFESYEPKSTLVVPENPTPRAQFPFVDAHSHQRAATMTPADVDKLVEAMDAMNMAVMINLSGGSGERLREGIARLEGRHPNRFVTFASVDFAKIDEEGFGEAAARILEQDVRAGARGLKIYKNLGMFLTEASGARVPTNDRRLDPIWRKAGELGIPVLIHTGEPSAFWEPVDQHNERWLELEQFPNRRRNDPKFASFEQTMGEQHDLFRRHPKTIFINAHLGWLGNDLARLGRLMDELPNMMTEIGAVLAELGRQPRAAREFLIRYQDRVLFGKDSWAPDEYPTYFRTLETADEYFDYYRRRHAHWKIYGLDLPGEVLRKIYFENALRIIPGLDATLFEKK